MQEAGGRGQQVWLRRGKALPGEGRGRGALLPPGQYGSGRGASEAGHVLLLGMRRLGCNRCEW